MWPLQHGHLLIEDRTVRQFWTGRCEFRKAVLPHDKPQCLRGPATVLTVYLRKQPDRTNTAHPSAAFTAGSSDLTVANSVAHPLTERTLMLLSLLTGLTVTPHFEVTEAPFHSRLVRRAGRDTALEDVTLFTQRDIDQGLLMLEPHANLARRQPQWLLHISAQGRPCPTSNRVSPLHHSATWPLSFADFYPQCFLLSHW